MQVRKARLPFDGDRVNVFDRKQVEGRIELNEVARRVVCMKNVAFLVLDL